MPCCFTVIFTLLGCYVVRFQALKTLFLIQDLSIAGSLVVGFQTLQGSQAAQAGSTVACLDRASIRYQNECGSVNEARRKCKKARFVLFFLLKLTSLTFKNSWEVILKQVYVYCENI